MTLFVGFAGRDSRLSFHPIEDPAFKYHRHSVDDIRAIAIDRDRIGGMRQGNAQSRAHELLIVISSIAGA